MTLLALGLAGTIGCGQPSADQGRRPAEQSPAAHDHDHGDAPHGGAIVELGGGLAHAELVHDEAAGKLTIYLLDASLEQSVAADDADLSLALVVDGAPAEYVVQAVDPAKRDVFASTDPSLLAALEGQFSKGRLRVRLEGVPVSGAISHSLHGDEDHDHPH